MGDSFYSTPRWRAASRACIKRDGNACTVGRLIGGECHGLLHAHHIVPRKDGGAPYDLDNLGSACASHHPKWEKLRRLLVRMRDPVVIACPECGPMHLQPFRSMDALELHLANVHGIGVPPADRELNRRMVRELLERLRTADVARAA